MTAASRSNSKSSKSRKAKSAASKVPPVTAEAWKKVMMNKHVILAISIGILVNALFVFLALVFGVVGVIILVIILFLICGGVGLRVSWVLRQKDKEQQNQTTTEEGGHVSRLEQGMTNHRVSSHHDEVIMSEMPELVRPIPSRPVSSLSRQIDSATQTDTLRRKFQSPISVNPNSLDDEQIMEFSDDDEDELWNSIGQPLVSITFATSARNWLANQASLSIHSHIHVAQHDKLRGLRSPSSWQMVSAGKSPRAYEDDSPIGSMVEVHRVDEPKPTRDEPSPYPNPIPMYSPTQVAAMYGLHGGFVKN